MSVEEARWKPDTVSLSWSRLAEREVQQRRDRKILSWAVAVALLVHVGVMLIHFPDARRALQPKKQESMVVVRKYIPPPPKVERREVRKRELERRLPLPDPTPDDPEPIREPEPEIEPDPLPPDVELLMGVPEPPPTNGPLLAGAGNVTNPVRIDESYVKPAYPEVARMSRVTGHVILQAVVYRDGSVGRIEILRCDRPNVGFETAAVEAVQQWRYLPATQQGKPVDVYFTIMVDFDLS